MQRKRKNILDIIVNAIMILLTILVVYWLIKLIFGGSPDLSEVDFALIILLAGFLFNIYREVGEIKIEMRYLSSGVKNSFDKIKEDVSLIKDDMDLLKRDTNLIKKKLKI